jgi:hypothetical protein
MNLCLESSVEYAINTFELVCKEREKHSNFNAHILRVGAGYAEEAAILITLQGFINRQNDGRGYYKDEYNALNAT